MRGNTLEHNNLTITLPDGWEDASQVIGLGPEEDGFRPNVIFSQEPAKEGDDAVTFAARQLPQLRDLLDNYNVERERTATFGTNSGFLREHTFAMDRGEIGQYQFYQVIDGRACTFTFTHLKHRFPSARPIAEKLFASARLVFPSHAPPDRTDKLDF